MILVNALISALLELGLARRLLTSAARAVVQLLLIGTVLEWIFRPGRQWYFVLGLMTIMTLIAGFAAVRRTRAPLSRRLARQPHLDVGHLLADGRVALFGVVQVQQAQGTAPGTNRSMPCRCWA